MLTTKLNIPPARSQVVHRQRLTDQLIAGLSRRLTLVSAPAGSGKTTLVSEFVRQIDRPVAWISLDAGDDDPTRFMTYLVAALQTVRPDIGQTVQALLHSPQPSPLEQMMVTLINELAAASVECVLVLDDYHLIKAEAIHNAVAFLLDNLPPTLHVVIAGRTSPPLPLPRWRGRGELTDVRMADLRFTPDEATAFLNGAMALGLTPEVIATLEARTEGWIAGLQLAALSLRRRDDGSQFVKTFTGRDRYILDYLVDEVISRQPERVQSFLLETAVLDRMTGPLCDAVTGQPDGQAMLGALEEANLFLVPLDNERRWYRYHHLFAEFLQARLRDHAGADGLATLHQRAARWHAQNGFTSEAVEHALAASDFELAAHLIEQAADELYSRGSIATLRRWLERLPEAVVRDRPRAAIYYAWVLFFAGEGSRDSETIFERADGYLRSAEKVMRERTSGAKNDSPNEELGMIYAVRTTMASAAPVRKSALCAQRDLARTIECGRQALAHLPEQNLIWRCVVNIGLGYAYRVAGNITAAAQSFAEASRLGHVGGNLSGALFARSNWASLLIMQGRLHEAEQVYQDALRVAAAHKGDLLPITGQIHIGLGRLLYEWNELEQAARYLAEGLKRAEAFGFCSPEVLMMLARVRRAEGDEETSQLLVAEAIEDLQTSETHIHSAMLARLEHVRLMLAQGDVQAASRWAKTSGLSFDAEPTAWREPETITFARVLIAQGQAEKIMPLVEALRRAATAGGRRGSLIEILAVQATAYHASGQATAAQTCLGEALAMAEPERYVRVFVDEGKPMLALLHQVYQSLKERPASATFSREYVERLLIVQRKAETVTVRAPEAVATTTQQPLVEPLSQRELEILRLIAAGRSNKEIAQELFVAVSTIKWHVNNIFGKLNVQSRTQAIARAQRLGIL
jgi:LuxR family maltose regulon positive regulatory protein